MVRLITKFALCFSLIAVCTDLSQAASFTSQTSGDWSSTGTWGGSGVPGPADSVTIATGTTVHADGGRSCSTLTVADNGTLFIDYQGSFNPDILTVSGDVINQGSLKLRGLLILSPSSSSSLRNSSAGNVFGTGFVRTQGNVLLQTDSAFNASLDVGSGTTTVANATGLTTFNGPIAVRSGALLRIGPGNSIMANLDLHVDGTLDGGDMGAGLIMNASFPGSPASAVSFSNDGLITGLGSLQFKSANAVYLSGLGTFSAIGTTTISAGATVTLESNLKLGALVINGTLDQGESAGLTAGPITIGSGGLLKNLGTGDLTLSGGLTNDGTIQINGGGPACGDAAKTLLRSSAVGMQRSWSGSGTFSLTDVDVQDQAGNAGVTAFGGVKSGNNGSNWTFLNCPNSSGNQIDQTALFVRQQYVDFLGRQADSSGFSFWSNEIASCGSDAQCIELKRINVSAAFFLSIEFQQTGNLVYKMYKAGFGNLPNKPVAVDRAPFLTDTRQIQSTPAQIIVGQGDWRAQLETNKQAFALAFVQRSNFQTQYAGQPAAAYVNLLFNNTGASPTAEETLAAVNAFNAAGGGDAGRAAALRSVAESASVAARTNNEAFVLMQYFGYLQRNPYDSPEKTLDYSGFNFWLGKLNQFNGDYIAAELVKAFITSSEYRQRFGP